MTAKPRRSRAVGVFLLKLVACGIALQFAVLLASYGLTRATSDGVIPASCRQPSSVDYSTIGPYAVKFTSWTHLLWGTSSRAVVGHDQKADSLSDYGVEVQVRSTDIGAFRCRWVVEGVTIIEPGPQQGAPGIEHFVPAVQFLGGR